MNESGLNNEPELIRLAAEGDREAFGKLYTIYFPKLFTSLAFLTKSEEDAQEILQDVFIKAWVSRETLVLVRSIGDYLFIMARNLLFDRMRKAKSRMRTENRFLDKYQSDAFIYPENELVFKEYYTIAYDALRDLSLQKQQIFQLRTQEGLTLDEIAEKFSISRSAVKKHFYSTLHYLKAKLESKAGWTSLFFISLSILYYFFK